MVEQDCDLKVLHEKVHGLALALGPLFDDIYPLGSFLVSQVKLPCPSYELFSRADFVLFLRDMQVFQYAIESLQTVIEFLNYHYMKK